MTSRNERLLSQCSPSLKHFLCELLADGHPCVLYYMEQNWELFDDGSHLHSLLHIPLHFDHRALARGLYRLLDHHGGCTRWCATRRRIVQRKHAYWYLAEVFHITYEEWMVSWASDLEEELTEACFARHDLELAHWLQDHGHWNDGTGYTHGSIDSDSE